MDNNKLIEFYENIHKLESFTIIKTIYELTNNLDVSLYKFLKSDLFEYHSEKIRKAMHQPISSDDEYPMECFFYELCFSENFAIDMSERVQDFVFEFHNQELIRSFISMWRQTRAEFRKLEEIITEKIQKETKSSNRELTDLEEYFIDEQNISIVKRIIYLQKLGIIDFLRKEKPFNTSINSLANVISVMISVNVTSVQPLLNLMLGKDSDNPKNPLNSAKNVSAVENYLIKIGYSLK